LKWLFPFAQKNARKRLPLSRLAGAGWRLAVIHWPQNLALAGLGHTLPAALNFGVNAQMSNSSR
jgi:hypothetical protein